MHFPFMCIILKEKNATKSNANVCKILRQNSVIYGNAYRLIIRHHTSHCWRDSLSGNVTGSFFPPTLQPLNQQSLVWKR